MKHSSRELFLTKKRLWDGDIAQLLEHRTGTPLTQVRFPGAARFVCLFFLSQSQLSVQTLSRGSVHPRVQSHATTSVRTLKILWSMSEFGGLWKH